MKKLSMLLSLLLALALILTGCGGNDNTGSAGNDPVDEDVEALPEEAPTETAPEGDATGGGTLVMATEAGFKPYEYYEGSDIVGVDVDIAREIAAHLGLELQIEDMAFDSIIPAVNSGKADFGAAGISITEERAEQVDFTIQYATSKQVIMVREDSEIESEDDLEGKIIGVQLGTVADLELADDYDVRQYNKYFEAANDLAAGRLDAIVLDALPAEELVKAVEGLRICENELFTDEYAFCVAKGNQELLDAINEVMEQLVAEGKIDAFTSNHLD